MINRRRDLFNKGLRQRTVPNDWNNIVKILLYKKAISQHWKLYAYGSATLAHTYYKQFMRILTKILIIKLDFYQSTIQTGFRVGHGTNNYL